MMRRDALIADSRGGNSAVKHPSPEALVVANIVVNRFVGLFVFPVDISMLDMCKILVVQDMQVMQVWILAHAVASVHQAR